MNALIQVPRFGRISLDDLAERIAVVLTFERWLPGEHLVQCGTKRVDVCPVIDLDFLSDIVCGIRFSSAAKKVGVRAHTFVTLISSMHKPRPCFQSGIFVSNFCSSLVEESREFFWRLADVGYSSDVTGFIAFSFNGKIDFRPTISQISSANPCQLV